LGGGINDLLVVVENNDRSEIIFSGPFSPQKRSSMNGIESE